MKKITNGIGKMATLPSCGLGAAVALLTGLALVSLGALCISNEYFTLQNISVLCVVVQFLVAFVGCITAGSVSADNQMISCAVTAGTILLTLICVAILFFDGVSGSVLVGAIAIIMGLAASLFIVLRKKKRSVRRAIRKRSR